jgi:DNA-binding transcriptional ArsR family regulator
MNDEISKRNKRVQELAKLYKALGEPMRLRIVELLGQHNELSCMEISERLDNVPHSTLSHHLKLLEDCGLVEFRKDGLYRFYRVQSNLLLQYAPILTRDSTA